jgi:hypothetical protein
MNNQSSIFMFPYSRPLVLEHRPIVFEETESTIEQPVLWSDELEGDDRVAIKGRLDDPDSHKNDPN